MLVVIWIGLVLSNYIFQYFMLEPNWDDAFERSFFQGSALFIVYVISLLKHGGES